jgi:hypothetical protein
LRTKNESSSFLMNSNNSLRKKVIRNKLQSLGFNSSI